MGENPQYGASINYYLKQAVPAGGTVTITNARNEVVRTLTGARRRRAQPRLLGPALRRRPRQLRFRTDPMYGHELPLGEDDTRPAAGGSPQIAVLAPPGRLHGEADRSAAATTRSR